MNIFLNALSVLLSQHAHKCTRTHYINLFDLAFHHIWTDSISSPLPWSLKAYQASHSLRPLSTSRLPTVPPLALSCPASLPNSLCCSPCFPIDGLCLAVSKANTSNQPALCSTNDERITSYHLSVIALLLHSCFCFVSPSATPSLSLPPFGRH